MAQRSNPEITATNVTPDEARFLEQHKNELSPSTLRAKWIHSANEHEDRPGQTLATRSHEVIMRWAAERNAVQQPSPAPSTKDDQEFFASTSAATVAVSSRR